MSGWRSSSGLPTGMGIERLCVFMGMNWSYDPSPEDMRQQNDEVLAALERWHIGLLASSI